MLALSFSMQMIFEEKTDSFGFSGGLYFASIFCLVLYKNALKPRDDISFEKNTTKRYYEKRGELHKYESLCKFLFIFLIIIGSFTFILGFVEVFIKYILSLLAK